MPSEFIQNSYSSKVEDYFSVSVCYGALKMIFKGHEVGRRGEVCLKGIEEGV